MKHYRVEYFYSHPDEHISHKGKDLWLRKSTIQQTRPSDKASKKELWQRALIPLKDLTRTPSTGEDPRPSLFFCAPPENRGQLRRISDGDRSQATKFFVGREGVTFGPYTEFQVRESVRLGIFEDNDFALAEDSKEWLEVS